MRILLIIETVVLICVVIFFVYFASFKSIDLNSKINFTFDSFIDYSIEMMDNKKYDEYLTMLNKIKKEIDSKGYETSYMRYVTVIKENLKNK